MKIQFSANIEVPDGTPIADVERWLEFELGQRCMLEGTNAMSRTDIESVGCTNVYARECN